MEEASGLMMLIHGLWVVFKVMVVLWLVFGTISLIQTKQYKKRLKKNKSNL